MLGGGLGPTPVDAGRLRSPDIAEVGLARHQARARTGAAPGPATPQSCERVCNSADARIRACIVNAATIAHTSIIAPAAESAAFRPWPNATYAAWVTSLTIFVIAGVPLNCLAWELNVPVVTAAMTVSWKCFGIPIRLS